MKDIAREDIDRLVGLPREEREKLDFSRSRFSHLNLAGVDLSGLNMEWSDFEDVSFAGADLTGVNLANVRCVNTSFAAANLRDADLSGAALRGCDLHNAHIEGANLYSANLEHARLDGIVDDERTQFFRLYPPATGAFLGYKKCFNDLLVQLLIPADAKRTSATLHSCRTNKAKVLSIKILTAAVRMMKPCPSSIRTLSIASGSGWKSEILTKIAGSIQRRAFITG